MNKLLILTEIKFVLNMIFLFCFEKNENRNEPSINIRDIALKQKVEEKKKRNKEGYKKDHRKRIKGTE